MYSCVLQLCFTPFITSELLEAFFSGVLRISECLSLTLCIQAQETTLYNSNTGRSCSRSNCSCFNLLFYFILYSYFLLLFYMVLCGFFYFIWVFLYGSIIFTYSMLICINMVRGINLIFLFSQRCLVKLNSVCLSTQWCVVEQKFPREESLCVILSQFHYFLYNHCCLRVRH